MLTLQELWNYYEKGYLHLRIDVFFSHDLGINMPEGLPDRIAEKLIKEKKVTIRGEDENKIHNFFIGGLSVVGTKGPFHSEISITFPKDAKLTCPGGLPKNLEKKLRREGRLTIQVGNETRSCTFNLNDFSLMVSVETAHAERRVWEKIKKQMREAGFSYRSESPWSCVYRNGKWDTIG